jgi:hypothetical protein
MKPIQGFADYLATDNEIFSNKYGRLRKLKQCLDKDGYYTVSVMNNSKKTTKRVHRLIAIAYLPNPENKKTVNHVNGIKTDNRIVNLEWATHSENSQHSVDIGLSPKGELCYNSKLKESQVLLILADKRSCRKIALDYNIDAALVSRIKLGKSWKHINTTATSITVN